MVSGRKVALAGNDADGLTGTAYAVFDLLRQWGCGWFAPDPLYHIIPSRPTVAMAECDRVERPAFDNRGPRIGQDASRQNGLLLCLLGYLGGAWQRKCGCGAKANNRCAIAARDAKPGRYVIPIDLCYGDRTLPQFTEAIVAL